MSTFDEVIDSACTAYTTIELKNVAKSFLMRLYPFSVDMGVWRREIHGIWKGGSERVTLHMSLLLMLLLLSVPLDP